MNEQSGQHNEKPVVARSKTRWITAIVLFGLLMFLASGIVRHRIRRGPYARNTAALVQIEALRMSLDAFHTDNGYFPRGTNGLLYLMQRPRGATNWQGPYLNPRLPLDPWSHNYVYECPGKHNPQSYDLSSTAPNGQILCNWKGR